MHLERVDGQADVLGGGDLGHPAQPGLGVDVDNRPLGYEHERHVGVPLPVLVQAVRRSVVMLELPLDGLVQHQDDGRQRRALVVG